MDRAQLEQTALEKISKMQTVPSAPIDRQALEQMALEKMSQMGVTEVDKETEASLGFVNRAKYALEPIQSNRKAFLEQEFGQENIMEDKNGDLYLKQNGAFLPLNKQGISSADFADVAGATPEIAGGVVGTVAGAVAGIPTGGTASVPMAIGMGAAGGAAGSAIRQGLSAAIGTPQVASMGERATETGLSGAFGGIGAGVGLAAKAGISKVKPGISQFFKNISKDGAEKTAKTTSKTTMDTVSQSLGQITPTYEKQTAQSIMGEVADQSGREVVDAEMKNLTEIATREGIPNPSYAQAAQGKALIAEARVLDMPLISGKVRKQYDGQLKAIKNNLESITGKFIDVESDAFEVGAAMREMAETSIEATKKASSELYQQVEEEGANAMIGKRTFFNKFRDKAGELGLINPDLSRAEYAADSSFTPETFKKLQDTIFSGIEAINKTPSPKIRFESANALRKFIKNSSEELKQTNPNAARLLNQFGRELDGTVEGILDREAPNLAEKFKAANSGWAKFREHEEIFGSITRNGNLDDEKIVKTVMSGTKNIEKMKELLGEKRVKDIAKTYIRDLLAPLGKSGIARADSALTSIRKQRPQIEAALGPETYARLVDNLHFLNRTGQPLNVSRASLYNILDNRGAGLKDLTLKLAGTAKTIAESKGTTVTGAAKGKIFETTGKVLNSATNKNASSAGNILGDNSQRSLSYFPQSKSASVVEREKEAERRKRAISGSK